VAAHQQNSTKKEGGKNSRETAREKGEKGFGASAKVSHRRGEREKKGNEYESDEKKDPGKKDDKRPRG